MNDKLEALRELQSKLAAYNHALALLAYDGVTTAPKGTAENRGVTMSLLSAEVYKLSTCDETKALLNELDAEKETLNAEEKRMVALLIKDQRFMEKIPMDEYVAYQELLVKADDVWHTAKETSDFALFEPCLTEIFATVRRFAGYAAPDKDPYDYWLNEYEEGLSKAVCDKFFSKLRTRLIPLIQKIGAAEQVDDSCLWGDFPADKQEELSYFLMKLIGLDLNHVGLSTTEHPFTTTLGSTRDVRITTRYEKNNVASSLCSVVHEGGHALYETNCNPDFAYTVLDSGVSMGIHESQSRFYENILGRSRSFCYVILPKLRELFPDKFADVTVRELYYAMNKVMPSLIRTEADEVTYALHVMIRYELEKRVMAGELSVHELPAEWNRLYKEYLGVDIPSDRDGVLQDSHWSGGAIGYFPSYALGSAYGAQLLAKMRETVDVDRAVCSGDLSPINSWLKDRIWQYGSLKTPADVLKDALEGDEFDADYFADYLEKKYSEIYNL